jgi:outer membrane protein OmpA-like peptidoglycan-associated protein
MNRQSHWLFEALPISEFVSQANHEYYRNPEEETEWELPEAIPLYEEEWETVGRLKVPRRSMSRRFQGTQVPHSRASSCPPISIQSRIVSGWSQYKQQIQELPADQQDILRKIGNEIRISYQPGCQPVRKVQVYGHADWDTPRNPKREQQMSDERTRTATNWLKNYVGSKIAPQITWDIQGFGATRLKAPSTTEVNRRQNRRVEIFLRRLPKERTPTVRISVTSSHTKNSTNRFSKLAPTVRSSVIIQPESINIPFGENREITATGDTLPIGSPAYVWSIADQEIVKLASSYNSQTHPNKVTITGKCAGRTQITVTYKTQSGNMVRSKVDVIVSPPIVGIAAAVAELKSKINNCRLIEHAMNYWNLTCGIAANRMVAELRSRKAFPGCRQTKNQISQQLYQRITDEGGNRCCVVEYRSDLATIIGKLRDALDDGFLVVAAVLSGACTGQAGRCGEPTCCNIPVPNHRKPFPDHYILIIGYENNKFVFWDPYGQDSNATRYCAGFGYLFFDDVKNRFSTAAQDSELGIIAGDHIALARSGESRIGIQCCIRAVSSPQHRYQILTVATT